MANEPSEGPALPHSIVLVGFMGAGKTAVGSLLAEELGWEFRDLDREIERRTGKTIPELFKAYDESFFRSKEAEVGAGLLNREHTVLATGGGWGAAPGRLKMLPKKVCAVWLQVDPEVAVDRVRREGPGRPLLDEAEDPVERARELIGERDEHYGEADLHIDTNDRTAAQVAAEIVKKLREDPEVDPS